MVQKISLQELGISISAKDLNPSALNSDFLKYSDIIPDDWELARPPVYTNRLVQILYKTGLSLIAQPNRLSLIELVTTQSLEDLQCPQIAMKCIDRLPKVAYDGLGINPRAFMKFESPEASHQYLTQQLMTPGPWSNSPNGPVQAAIQLVYPQPEGKLNLAINEASVQRPESDPESVILFSGSFSYELDGDTQPERLQRMQQLISRWQIPLQQFQETLQPFEDLAQNVSLPLQA
ncbi:MAG: hypothetical protein WA902_00990 [Thermosynechococcaceae cyanobacterium]